MRWPAEWEPQSALLIAWPHARTDWADNLAEAECSYIELAHAVTRFEPLVIAVADAALREHVERLLEHDTGPFPVHLVQVPYDDTWLRDTGPVTLTDDRNCFVLADFRFDGWGGKFDAHRDDQLCAHLAQSDLFAHAEHQHIDWVLEGGAIESDGLGTILSTWHCLHARHPGLNRTEVEQRLVQHLHAQRILWLEHGHLEGDDTDAHIDTLARFAPGDRIVYQACDDKTDAHHAEFQRMADELAELRTLDGKPYELVALPWPQPIIDNGRRLAASYANYLVINDAVLVPAYGDPADTAAASLIGQVHPKREVVPIPCRPLIQQNGSLHCITMQLPAGVLEQAGARRPDQGTRTPAG